MKIVVLDDASTDSTSEIVASFSDPSLRYIRHERNIGALNNWNYAIDLADTEYVNVFHGDDRMFPWMIETLVDALEDNHQAGLAASAGYFFMNSAHIPASRRPAAGKYYRATDFVKEYAEKANYSIVAPSITIRKKTFDRAGIRYRSDVGPAADTYFVLEANGGGIDIFTTDEPLLAYRRHESNWTNKSGFDTWFNSLRRVEELAQRILPQADMSLWRTKYANWLFITTSDIQSLKGDIARRRNAAEAADWHISDDEFLESILSALKTSAVTEPNCSIVDIEKGLSKIFDNNHWKFSERVFKRSALRHTVRDFIKHIGAGAKTFTDYRKFRACLAQSGLKIPLYRELAWFWEYALLKKM
jgi:glycosyltransferase involved in cell wall biosynthesis